MATRKKKPAPPQKRSVISSIESAANTLRGVNMHLAVIRSKGVPELAEPIRAILDVTGDLDAAAEVLLASEGGK